MTTKKYTTILADPPWPAQSGENHYLTLPMQRIKQLGIALESHIADDAHCWIWVTNGTIADGMACLAAWGFEYRSLLTWVKPRLGLGPYLRNMTEHVLLGTRGKAPAQFRGQGTWLFAPVQDHSHKPEEVHDIIERFSPGPNRLELFARRARPGWDHWGNEIRSDVDLVGFPVPDSPLTRGEVEGAPGDVA
jgi:N6-adenosine-specific RNA methylase IME4